MRNCSKFVTVHSKRTISCNMNNATSCFRKRNTNSCASSVTHCSKSTRSYKTTLFSKRIKLSRPHLMLTNFCCNKTVIANNAMNMLTNKLWIYRIFRLFVVTRWISFFPFINLIKPFFVFFFIYKRNKFCKNIFYISNNTCVCIDIFINFRRINIDM